VLVTRGRPPARRHPAATLVSRAAGDRPHAAGRPGVRDLLPADTPYPAIEVRAPGETAYLRANDRAITPIALKLKFGEFTAVPGVADPTQLEIDPTWINDNIQSATLPLLGTVTCHTKTLFLLKRAMRALVERARRQVAGMGVLHPIASPDDPSGPLTAAAWGHRSCSTRGEHAGRTDPVGPGARALSVGIRVGRQRCIPARRAVPVPEAADGTGLIGRRAREQVSGAVRTCPWGGFIRPGSWDMPPAA
jgi:hypothetical protein